MKNMIVPILTLVIVLLSCDKNESKSKNSISIFKVDYSGCFTTEKKSQKLTTDEMKDSLYYKIENSVLNLKIDMVYPCCGILKDSVVIDDNIVSIYVDDKNENSFACNCICLFKINYSLIDLPLMNIYFKVYMKNIIGDNFSLWKETKFIDRLDK